jgi:hypothetical protein
MNKWFFLIVIFDFGGSGGVVYLSDTACPNLILIDVGDSGGVGHRSGETKKKREMRKEKKKKSLNKIIKILF